MDNTPILCRILFLFIFYGSSLCCNSGWYLNNQMCYQASQSTYDVRLARRYCQVFGGDLAYVNSSSTLRFLNVMPHFDGQRSYWLKESSSITVATTAPPLSTAPTDETSEATSSSGCPYARILDILSDDCISNKYFICEVPEHDKDISCPTSWDLYGSTCYKAINALATRNHAVTYCELQHAELAVLDDIAKEHHAAATIIGKNSTFLVGAMIKKTSTDDREVFRWSNGKEFQPSCLECRTDSPGDCIGFRSNPEHPTIFTWVNVNCSSEQNFLCEMLPTVQSTVMTTTVRPTTAAVPLVCPHGFNWKVHEESGYCYWETTYETERLNWYQARTFCQAYGGDLASYHSAGQEDHGLGGARGHYKGLWIGLKRGQKDDIFRWSDGTALNYTKWDYNEPKLDSRSKLCVIHGAGDSDWELDYCGVRRWFICKAPKARIAKSPETGLFKKTACNITGESIYRNRWFMYEDHCYLVHEMAKFSWYTARTFCQDNDAHMASIHSFNETDFILSSSSVFPDTDFWIGLSSQGLHSSYSWSDGTPLDFLYWPDGANFSESEKVERCITFNRRDGAWSVEHCNRHQGVICKRGVNSSYEFTSPAPTPLLPGYCESGWYLLGNKCYKHFGQKRSQRTNWVDAQDSCKSMGATLASVHNSDEQEFLTDLVLEVGADAYIGLQSYEGTMFRWSDESRMDYTNWNSDEPELSRYSMEEDMELFQGAPEFCVAIVYNRNFAGKWNDMSCFIKNAYICQKPKDPSLTEPSEDPFACLNITDWSKLGSSCYGIFEQKAVDSSWLDAQKKCRKVSANLVTFRSSAVGVFLNRRIARKDTLYWTGALETSNNLYETVNGQRLLYAAWESGQPQRASTDLDNCVAMNALGHWIVRSCQEKYPFICEWNPDDDKEEIVNERHYCTNTSNGWEDLGGDACYLLSLSMKTTWNEAMLLCFRHGGYLASFHSKKELSLIQKYVLGLDEVGFLHIGLAKRRDGSHAWVDNSPVDFTFWDDGEPEHTNYHCTQMFISSGKWSDVDCDETSRGFICASPKKTFSEDELLVEDLTNQKTNDNQSMSTGGILGIVVCVVSILLVIGLAAYYLAPWTRIRPRKLLEPEAL